MKKTEVESFEKLPFLNPKFNAFFQAKDGIAVELKNIFDLNSERNAKFNELPHNVYVGEDLTEIFSNDSLVDFVCQYDNHGVGKIVLGSFSLVGFESSLNYNFTITDDPTESNFSIAFTRYEKDADFVKSTSGVEVYSPKGLQSTLQNTIVSSSQTGEMLEARSSYGFYNDSHEFCSETLVFEYPSQVQNPQSSLLEFRQEMLDSNATAVYLVDGKRAELDKVDDIIRTTEQVFGTQTTEFLPN